MSKKRKERLIELHTTCVLEVAEELFEKKGFYENPLFQLNSALIYDYLDDLKEKDDKAREVNYMSHKDYIDVYEKHPDFNFEDEGFYKRISDSITKGQRLMLGEKVPINSELSLMVGSGTAVNDSLGIDDTEMKPEASKQSEKKPTSGDDSWF